MPVIRILFKGGQEILIHTYRGIQKSLHKWLERREFDYRCAKMDYVRIVGELFYLYFFCLEFHVVFVHEKREIFPNIFVGLIKHRNASYFERIFCQHVWYVDYISNHRKILSWLICFFPLFIVWCCVIPHEMSNNEHYFVSQNYRLVARQKEICLQKYLNSFVFCILAF